MFEDGFDFLPEDLLNSILEFIEIYQNTDDPAEKRNVNIKQNDCYQNHFYKREPSTQIINAC